MKTIQLSTIKTVTYDNIKTRFEYEILQKEKEVDVMKCQLQTAEDVELPKEKLEIWRGIIQSEESELAWLRIQLGIFNENEKMKGYCHDLPR